MQDQHDRSVASSASADLGDELLQSRMVIVGLFSGALERDDSATFDLLRRNCLACADRAPCEADLRDDPANPVWQRYCPNAAKLNALAASQRTRG
jgi:hypothetical protein